MGDLEEKLNEILSSPESMEQIMRLAQSLGGGAPKQTEPQPEQQPPPGGGATLDPKLMSTILSLMEEMNRPDDKAQLMNAIKPYLKQERQQKLDQALRIARLAKLARTVLPELGESGHV